jgi:hypothetical protein
VLNKYATYAKRDLTGDFAMQLPVQVSNCTIIPTLPAVLGAAVEIVLPGFVDGKEAGRHFQGAAVLINF